MKKRIVLLAVCLLTQLHAFSQKPIKQNFGNNFQFQFTQLNPQTHKRTPTTYIAGDTAIYTAINVEKKSTKQQGIKPASPIMLGVKLNPKLNNIFPQKMLFEEEDYCTYRIPDSSDAIVVALGITKYNIKDYRYRVVINSDEKHALWQAIPGLQQKYGAKQPYGFIGKFKSPGEIIRIEVINTKDRKIIDGILFDARDDRARRKAKSVFGRAFRFEFVATDKRMMVRQPFIYSDGENDFNRVLNFGKSSDDNTNANKRPKSPIMLGVKLNPKLSDYYSSGIKSYTKSYSGYIISDTSSAILIALGITRDNVNDYRYHVVENDSVEVVPWSKIPKLEQNYDASRPYGFIGKFKAPGKQLLVEVMNIKKYGIRDGVVFDWRVNFKPIVTEIQISQPDNGTNRIYYFNLNYAKLNHGYATRFDPKSGLPLNFKFPIDSIDNLQFTFKNHETVPYSVHVMRYIGKKDTTSIEFQTKNNVTDDVYRLEKMYFSWPGKYEVIFQRNGEYGKWGESQMLRIPFTVLPPPAAEKKISIKQALPYIIGVLAVIALLFWLYRRRSNIKLAKSVQARQTTSLKMRSIRAQLNPHFMFNALTSIQNLMNKNDTESANHYLSRFADLTRKVLNTSEQELISLEDELKILDDYLQMEQLRFNFQYQLKVDGGINKANTEVPAMLIQPFVENAVKHGVAHLREKGNIQILINKKDTDLVLLIIDNGPGFKQSDNTIGAASFGLKLSAERVKLLNEIYKDQPATLNVASDATGTTITITLTNWIS